MSLISSAANTKSAIKTAIIGYGFSAKTFHIPFISNMAEFAFVAISSRQQERVNKDWPNTQYFASPEALITQSDAELVIITAPNDVHFSLAKLALENNKHVILEKPFVTNSHDGERLIALAEKNHKLLSVFQNRRYDGDFLTVQKLIREQQLGEIKVFEAHFDRFRPEVRQRWREQASDGGGILFDLGPHLIDQALQLFGMPQALTAQCRIIREGGTTVDYFNLVLHYPDKIAVLHADMLSATPNRRFTIQGSKGTFQKYGLDPQESRLIAGLAPTKANWADEDASQYGQIYHAGEAQVVVTERGGYQHYFQATAEAIRNNLPHPVSAEQALNNIKIIELAIKSSELGQTLRLAD
ncbi:oxidoreductase [uncultured Paraglaciecola sp.]|uniref:oxidoreductase n=1 Tax=uncultured Paraglaciecola sp. TaxID=1765024 RepID=UPI0030D89A4C|tara:strand:- start:3238 stop:4302 length:1065 start_codon:yes stop_codon:yes gene_type:complete